MKFCIIGLGRFGYEIATVLAENGQEVMAIDSNESIVASIRDKVTQALCMRVTDEASLRSIGIDEIETVIVATGENFAQAILITAILKKRLHVKRVIARAINEIHKEILKLIGADEIVLPEQEIGIRLADSLSSSFNDQVRLTKNVSIIQVEPPASYVGSQASMLPYSDYNIHFVGIKKDDNVVLFDTRYKLAEHDKLILAGNNDDLERFVQGE